MSYLGRAPTGSILTGADIADGSISTAKLADTAVSTAKIADDAVTSAKATGLGSLFYSGKAHAPTVVPEGVEVTPENIEKYGKILMENQ